MKFIKDFSDFVVTCHGYILALEKRLGHDCEFTLDKARI